MGFDEIGDRGLRRRIKQHLHAKEHDFFAVLQPGFEEQGEKELKSLGEIKVLERSEGGILFRSGLETCFLLNLASRTVTRFLMRLAVFRAENFRRLRKKAEEFPWELYLKEGSGIGFSTRCRNSRLYHTERIEDELLAGIRRRLSAYNMEIPGPGSRDVPETQRVFIRFDHNICTLSLDTSGELLYKRGYKTGIGEAPLRETLAALILLEAKAENYDLVIDPLCGSGTLSLEAAGILTGKLPSLHREFAFMNWPSFKRSSFEYMKRKLAPGEDKGSEPVRVSEKKIMGSEPVQVQEKEIMGSEPERILAEEDKGSEPIRVIASDIGEENVNITAGNLERAGLASLVTLSRTDFLKERIKVPEGKRSLLVINPPYGKRLSGTGESFYRSLGRVIRDNYAGSGYAIISPSLEHEKIMGLPYDRKILFINGGIKVGLIVKDRY